MAMTQTDEQALDALRYMVRNVPRDSVPVVEQTLRVWPMLRIDDKIRHYARARTISERSCPMLRSKDRLAAAAQALEAQARLFL